MPNDPRETIHQAARPLDRFFYDRDQGGGSWEGFNPDNVVREGTDIVVSWSNPGDQYFQFRVKRDGQVISGNSALGGEVTSFTDTTGTDPSANYRIQGKKRVPTGNEVGEYDRHRAMFWELYADYWNGKYSTDYPRYYDPDQTAVPGGNARSQAWHPASESYPGYGKQADDNCPYTRAPLGGPVSQQSGSSGAVANVIGERPGWVDPKVLGPKLKAAMGQATFEQNHAYFDKSQEAFGAARGCYEVWTDIFVDVTDGFRGGYQNGDMRWIFRTPKNEEFVYTKDIQQEMYGMDGQFNWSTVIGTKELPVDGMGEDAWAVSNVSNHFYGWDESSDTPGSIDADDYDDHFGIVVREETRAGSDNFITSSTKVDNWLKTESINKDGDNEIKSVTKYDGEKISEETIKPGSASAEKGAVGGAIAGGVLGAAGGPGGLVVGAAVGAGVGAAFGGIADAVENGDVYSRKWCRENNHHFGRVEEMFIGGQASFSLSGKVSLEISTYLETVIALATEIFVGGKVELALGGKYELSMPTKLDFSPSETKVKAMETKIAAQATKMWGSFTSLFGSKNKVGAADTSLGTTQTNVNALNQNV